MRIYARAVALFKEEHPDEEVLLVLDHAIETIDDVLLRMEFDAEHRALKLLGVKASKQLLLSIIGVIGSIGLAVTQAFFMNG